VARIARINKPQPETSRHGDLDLPQRVRSTRAGLSNLELRFVAYRGLASPVISPAQVDRARGSFGMDDFDTEAVWRKALQDRGKDWVMAELHRRPGKPEDPLYDVVFKEPYPTRAFCFQWCGEEENKYFRMSWHTYATIIALALLIVSIVKGISAWNDEATSLQTLQAQTTASGSAGAGGSGDASAGANGGTSGGGGTSASASASGSASTLTNDIPSMSTSPSTIITSSGTTLSSPGTTVSGSGTTSSGSALTTGQSAPASICGYITYASPRCTQQNSGSLP
jgi:hypothetical protein